MFDLNKEWRAKLEPREFPGGDLVVAEIRYEKGGNVRPYFSICGAVYGRTAVRGEKSIVHEGVRFWPHSFGQVREELLSGYPELASAMRWHLSNAEGPMHYIDNGVYWAQLMHGVSVWQAETERTFVPRPGAEGFREIFSSHVVLGAVEGDTLPAVALTDDEITPTEHRAEVARVVEAWLLSRLPALKLAFARDMQHLHARYGGADEGGAS